MDESNEQRPQKVSRTLLVGLALGLAVGIGQALGPDIAERARVWLDRVLAAGEAQAVSFVEQYQAHQKLEREVREGTGAVIWEALEALEEERP
jgi:hypothetical protein